VVVKVSLRLASNFQNPIIRPNERSLLSYDAPKRFVFWGNFGVKYGITVTPVLDLRNGFPLSNIDEDRNFVGERNRAGRYPTFASLDMQVLKSLSGAVAPLRPETFTGTANGVLFTQRKRPASASKMIWWLAARPPVGDWLRSKAAVASSRSTMPTQPRSSWPQLSEGHSSRCRSQPTKGQPTPGDDAWL
jgi:hypothetical protein